MVVLTVNTGSSSVRLALFAGEATTGLRVCAEARYETDTADPRERLTAFLDRHASDQRPRLAAHRVVHGGAHLTSARRIDATVEAEIERLAALAPLHNPVALSWIRACRALLGTDVPQVAVFDTAFYAHLPEVARTYALPHALCERHGVRRYGFHGLAHQSLWLRWRELRPDVPDGGRVVSFQLGAGCSVTAIDHGRPLDTSMGFSPLEGLVMATRSGDVDPGLMTYLQRVEGLNAADMERLLNEGSGLLGVSGASGDMRTLLAADDARARLAVQLYCYRARKYIGAYLTVLSGADAVLFGGGVGEHAAVVRAGILAGLAWAGLRLDAAANTATVGREGRISANDSAIEAWVIPVDEAQVLAAEALAAMTSLPRRDTMKTTAKTGTNVTSTTAPEEFARLDAWWRAANYLSVGQIYLLDNPLLSTQLQPEHVKPRLLGHWGTTPGLNFIYAHLNRIINKNDLDMIYIAGPGHGGPALVANTWLEGSYSEFYPNVSRDAEGMQRLFRQFSFPGGIGSHVTAEVPGSIHEGGELGYALSHAFGAAFDNPGLIVACVIGDGEAETGPLAAAWHSNKFLSPVSDGAVLPILHLNGYKIANPTVLARIPRAELDALLSGYGYRPYFVEGSEPDAMHRQMAATLDAVIGEIHAIQHTARSNGNAERARWPMIVLRSPKGWTGPKEVDGKKTEGSWRSHQVPFADTGNPEHLKLLEQWLKSYRPEELFDTHGVPRAEIAALAPRGTRRMGSNPHANGGTLLRDLRLPDFRDYAVNVPQPGGVEAEATRVMGSLLRDVMQLNMDSRNFRVVGPDETTSNRLDALLEVTGRTWLAERLPEDEHLAPDGRVMEILSEHTCQGWLEGYLLTGRHGLFSCYEAFIHIVDSMFNQHAKWLKVSKEIPWRRPIASLNYLLTSHVWRQDHNGFSHQDPGFIDHVVNKKADIIRVYLPPDANTLLCVTDRCLRSRNLVNVIVAGKQRQPQWLAMDAAIKHCAAGIGIFDWASNDQDGEPDVVMACAGDVPTLETLAAVDLLRQHLPELKVRVVNVVDLMTLQQREEHPHGLTDRDFDTLFTTDKPILFAYHGYPWLIHRLTYRRINHKNLHVRGYKEEGTTTTPFDMAVLNDLDRFHLVTDVVNRVPVLGYKAAYLKQFMRDRLIEHGEYIRAHGQDMPEIREWQWPHAHRST